MAEQKAAERVERALDRLACLDAVEASVDLDVFTRTLELELEADLGRVGRMGEGVLVGSVSMGVGLDLDLVVVLGLAEGSSPSPTRDDSLLPDHERAATGDELPLAVPERRAPAPPAAGRPGRRVAPRAVCARVAICVATSSGSRPAGCSQIASAMAGERWWSDELLGAERDWLDHVASFDAGLRRVDFPATEQEYRLRSLMVHGSTRLSRLGPGRRRATRRWTPAPRSSPPGAVIASPASTATWLASPFRRRPTGSRRPPGSRGGPSCPFAYLLRNILGVEEVENPEDQLQISPRDRGSLVHEALERFIDEVLARPAADRPGPDEPWSASDRARHGRDRRAGVRRLRGARPDRAARSSGSGTRSGSSPTSSASSRPTASTASSHGTRPVAAELAFGLPGAALGHRRRSSSPTGGPSTSEARPTGSTWRTTAPLHVVDYKTGKADDLPGPERGQS